MGTEIASIDTNGKIVRIDGIWWSAEILGIDWSQRIQCWHRLLENETRDGQDVDRIGFEGCTGFEYGVDRNRNGCETKRKKRMNDGTMYVHVSLPYCNGSTGILPRCVDHDDRGLDKGRYSACAWNGCHQNEKCDARKSCVDYLMSCDLRSYESLGTNVRIESWRRKIDSMTRTS